MTRTMLFAFFALPIVLSACDQGPQCAVGRGGSETDCGYSYNCADDDGEYRRPYDAEVACGVETDLCVCGEEAPPTTCQSPGDADCPVGTFEEPDACGRSQAGGLLMLRDHCGLDITVTEAECTGNLDGTEAECAELVDS